MNNRTCCAGMTQASGDTSSPMTFPTSVFRANNSFQLPGRVQGGAGFSRADDWLKNKRPRPSFRWQWSEICQILLAATHWQCVTSSGGAVVTGPVFRKIRIVPDSPQCEQRHDDADDQCAHHHRLFTGISKCPWRNGGPDAYDEIRHVTPQMQPVNSDRTDDHHGRAGDESVPGFGLLWRIGERPRRNK